VGASGPLAARVADDLGEATRAITEVLESVFASVGVIGERVVELRRRALERGVRFAPRHLAQARPVILEQLRRHPFADGFGVLSAPELVLGRTRYLEWWRHDGHQVIPLWLNFDPTSVDIYDYFEMEWFTNAQRRHARTVFGPYVDACSDHYVITMTSPLVDGAFLGVVGADVRMSLFEADLLAVFGNFERDVVLVNAERRVILANSPRWTVGARLSSLPSAIDDDYVAVASVGADSNWLLAAVD
jgi:Methyl-accepting chemotaxis protein-like, first PDC sensor domain